MIRTTTLNPLKCAFGVGSGKFMGFMVNQRGMEANLEKIRVLLEMSLPKKSKEVMSLTGRVAALSQFVSRATDHCAPFFDMLKGSKRFKWIDKCKQVFQALKEHLGRPPLLSKPIEREKLYLYLDVSKEIVSTALVREEEKVQWPIYYVSKRLLDAETRYLKLEKLALAFVVTSRKLRSYFYTHSIEVLTNYPLCQVLKLPKASSRLLKWSIELRQFDVNFRPRTTIKGQALADFIVEFTYADTVEVVGTTDDAEATKVVGAPREKNSTFAKEDAE